MELEKQVGALEDGSAAVELSNHRVIRVLGSDADGWLSDLLTAEVRNLGTGASRPAMLLTPTGSVRAVVTVSRPAADLLLVQDRSQPEDIGRLLARYILSSDVELVEEHVSVAAVLDESRVPPGVLSSRPSSLGSGADVFGKDMVTAEIAGVEWVGDEAVERWRIRRGLARFPSDLGTHSLPHEVDHGSAVDDDRGCYLGQEAVARVRNLGHPPWIVLAVHGKDDLRVGESLVVGDQESGRVTSATGRVGIVRVRWKTRKSPLIREDGSAIEVLGQAGLMP